ncbi:MAG: hypothetical protein QM718_08040 [Steroidobacteraceae bacterium]
MRARCAWLVIGLSMTTLVDAADAPAAAGQTQIQIYGASARTNLSGLYRIDFGALARQFAADELAGKSPRIGPPLTPEYEALYQKRLVAVAAGRPYADPASQCLWYGMPRMMIGPVALELLQLPGQLVIISAESSEFRHIYIDGRSHPADVDPSYEGHSIGHWEGAPWWWIPWRSSPAGCPKPLVNRTAMLSTSSSDSVAATATHWNTASWPTTPGPSCSR